MIIKGLQLRKATAANDTTFSGDALPTSVRAFHWGWNDFSPKTMTFVSPEQARVVVARFGSRLVSFDWEHEPTSSYGHGVLTIHSDGLYIDQIKWTDLGVQSLQSKGELFISPAYWEDHRRWLHSFVNAALTKTPATVFARQLVAASALGEIMTPEEFIEWLRKTLGLDATAALEVMAKAIEDMAAAAANATGPAAASGAAPVQQSAPAGPVGGIVPGAMGMVMASLLALHKIDPKSENPEAQLLARAAEAIASQGGIGERIAKVEASTLAATGEAKLRAFLGDTQPRQPGAPRIPTTREEGNKDRETRISAHAARSGVTQEQLDKHDAKSGYRKVV